jgi:hypothetical protein
MFASKGLMTPHASDLGVAQHLRDVHRRESETGQHVVQRSHAADRRDALEEPWRALV